MRPENLSTILQRQKRELARALWTASLFLGGTFATAVALLRDLQIT